jgi:hypothetical protein
MKRLVLAVAVVATVVQGMSGAEAANSCQPQPQCCPLDPQCWTTTNHSSDTSGGGGAGRAASAAVVRSGCHFSANNGALLTGGNDTFTGASSGYVLLDDQGTHTLRCYIAVDGSEVASTPTGSGTGSVTTSGSVTYTTSSSDVDLCIEIDGATTSCGDAVITQVPPQEVVDLVENINIGLVDPLGCPLLAALSPGIPGIVDISPEGDVHTAGSSLRDCPPYGN